nr:serine hydrolase domain-containing protein [uncultured Roseateles sp.]
MTLHSNIHPVRPFALDALHRLDGLVTDFVELLGNLGVLVAIDVDGLGRVSFTAGHSNLEKSRTVQPGDVFEIGSQSKTVTAMTLVLLARDGLLNLDDPVSRHLDLPIDRRITVRHLLMNASGLGEYTYGIFGARFDPRIKLTPHQLLAFALSQGQVFEPGAHFDYCNTGWLIAAMLIEAITGKRYSDVTHERIAKPLGLKASGFGGMIPTGERMHCYWTLEAEPEPVDMSGQIGWAFGAGDGLCNADDILAIYSSLVRRDSPLGITLNDLASETLKPPANPYFALSAGTEYGLGLERRSWAGSEVWGHPGSTGACRTSTWIDVARRVAITTVATTHISRSDKGEELRYPRAQLFSMALNTAYALATERD